MTRLVLPEDFDFIFGLYMHPEVNPYLLYEQMDAEAFKPIFLDLLQRNIIYIFQEDSKAVGMFKLIPQQFRNAHTAYLGGLAIHPSFSGKGYGLKMMQAIIALAKSIEILRIELSVAVANTKA